MSNDMCAIHGYEPLPENCYRICGECFHGFVTEQELIDADLQIRQEVRASTLGWYADGFTEENYPEPEPLRGAVIDICPHCTHDF